MSATGRGTNRDSKDFYATPWPAIQPLIGRLPTEPLFYDPCCGDGRLVKWLRESGRKAGGSDLYPQAECDFDCQTQPRDFLADFTSREFLLTNHPFSVAFEMCQHARRVANEFLFLLRLSFLESEERGDWLSANEPSALFVLRKRPSFVMSVTCKSTTFAEPSAGYDTKICKHNWLLPIEAERPKVCPVCGGSNLAISTSDNSGYAWFYWGHRFEGIHHI